MFPTKQACVVKACAITVVGTERYPCIYLERGAALPYIGYMGMCGPIGYGFSAVWSVEGMDFDHFGYVIEYVLKLKEATFFIVVNKTINKSTSQIMYMATVSGHE